MYDGSFILRLLKGSNKWLLFGSVGCRQKRKVVDFALLKPVTLVQMSKICFAFP